MAGKPTKKFARVAWKSHQGLVRPGNEDYAHVDEEHGVFAVCDGMGGHQAGEVASMTASQTLSDVYTHHSSELASDIRLALPRTLPPKADLLAKGIRLANRAVHSAARADQTMAGMGTTIVAVTFDSEMLSIAHVGDSRAYRLEQNKLNPLTVDHSWVSEMQRMHNLTHEEASSVVAKNIITRALGVKEGVEIDYRLIRTKPEEIYILCSDGLCGYADDNEIFQVARNHRENLQKLVDELVQMANDRGGADNVTIIALQILESADSQLPEIELITFPAESEELLSYQDGLLAKMAEKRVAREQNQVKTKQPNKLYLALIFAAFVVLAGAVILMSGGK
jgi:PPM family protein phosphatase